MTARRPLITAQGYLKELAGTDTLQLNAGAAAGASANLPHGAAPTSPVDGDLWTTSAGVFAQVNGSTVGPLGAGGSGSPGGSSGQIQYNNAGAFGAFTASGDATINTATGAVTLATVNSNVGSFGDGTHVGVFTVNAKGLIVAASSVAITASGIGAAPAAVDSVVDAMWFGDGSDGNVTVTTSITLSRDMYYDNLTISGSGSINTASYRIFVRTALDITAAGAGAIKNNGGNANAGTGNVGAGGGTGITANTVGGSSSAGNGANGGTGAGSQASNVNAPSVVGGLSGAGGKGGVVGATAGGASRGATARSVFVDIRRLMADLVMFVTTAWTRGQGGGSAPGGSSGAGDGVGSGGGGGAGGRGGGVVYVAARTIARGLSTAVGAIQALGGDGGAGASGSGGTNRGGGGGGAGAGGGWIYLIYRFLTGVAATGALDATGGTGGAGANGVGSGGGGDAGGGGEGGRIDAYDLGAGTQTITETVAATTGAAASGSTGGTATSATAQRVNL